MRQIIGGLALAIALSACAVAPKAPATVGVADVGAGGSIVLLDSPCAGKAAALVAERIKPQFRVGWRSAEGTFRMMRSGSLKHFSGCWIVPPREMSGGERAVLLIFEDGDVFALPCAAFGMCKAGTGI